MNKNIKRTMIIGRPGAGKSTFAIDLHNKFNFKSLFKLAVAT